MSIKNTKLVTALKAATGHGDAVAALKEKKTDIGNAILSALAEMQAENPSGLAENVARTKVAFYDGNGWKGHGKWIDAQSGQILTLKSSGTDKPDNTVSGYFSRINKALEMELTFADYGKWSDMVDATRPEKDELDVALSELFGKVRKMEKMDKERLIKYLADALK